MLVGIAGPGFHHLQRARLILAQEWPDGEFGAAIGREGLQRHHRSLEMVEAVQGDIFRRDQRDEAVVDARDQGAEDRHRLMEVARQGLAIGPRDLTKALHDRQGVQVVAGQRQEPVRLEGRIDGACLVGQVA